MNNKNSASGHKDINFLKIIKNVNIKPGGSQRKYKIDKESISEISQNIKTSIIKSIEKKPQQINELINSFKKNKLRELEKLLRVEKSQLIVSNRKNYIYRSESGKMYIVDRDMWGDPHTVTIKDNHKVLVKCIKYLNDKPFLFPLFNEKNVKGKIIHMENSEIWYHDNANVCVVNFPGSEAHFTNIQISNYKSLSQEQLFTYIKNYLAVNKNRHLNEMVKTNNIRIEDIVKARKGYIISLHNGKSYKVLLYSEEYAVTNEFIMDRLPEVSDDGLDVLFSDEILSYIRNNQYTFENFKQNDDFIEYWQRIGSKDVCVMRYKV